MARCTVFPFPAIDRFVLLWRTCSRRLDLWFARSRHGWHWGDLLLDLCNKVCLPLVSSAIARSGKNAFDGCAVSRSFRGCWQRCDWALRRRWQGWDWTSRCTVLSLPAENWLYILRGVDIRRLFVLTTDWRRGHLLASFHSVGRSQRRMLRGDDSVGLILRFTDRR